MVVEAARRLYPGTHARERPDAPAIVFAPTGEVTTWRRLDERSNQLARLLAGLGLRRGDHIAILSENQPAVFELVWAALRSGLYYTPVSSLLTAPEAGAVLRASGATVLFGSEACRALARSAGDFAPAVAHWFTIEDLDEVTRGLSGDPLDEEPEGAPLWFSSGTSGQPKAVVRPLPTEPGDPVAAHYATTFGLDEDTVHLCVGPLHHAAPIGFSTAVQRVGGTIVLTDRFDPESILRLIEQHRVTFSHLVPTMFVRLLKLPDEVRARYDLSSLRRVIHGAAPCPVEVKRRMIEWWGPVIDEYYGGTEGVGSTTITSAEWLEHPGSVGRASRGIIHITDDDGTELGPGEDGMVFFENPTATTEYRGDAEQTAAITHPAGWQTLGDIGHLDEDGYLFLTDRWTHKIVTGGVNVFPREVEDVLLQHPAVLDVAVIGVPDDDMGEAIKAVVQLVDPAAATGELAAELIDFSRDHLARHKCPWTVDFDPALPRQENGKLYARLIRDRYWAGQARKI